MPFIPPNKINWTIDMDNFLKENFEKLTNQQLADTLGIKLTSTRTRLYELGFKRMELEYWTEEQIQYLKNHYRYIGDTEIAETFDRLWHKNKGWSKKHIEKKRRYLKLKRTKQEQKDIHQRNVEAGRFAMCATKRWETVGTTPVGIIRIWRHMGGEIKVIRMKEGFMKLSHYNWSIAYGSIENGAKIIHKDGNPLNCELENLQSVTCSELMEMNAGSVQLSDGYVAGIMTPNNPELRKKLKQRPDILSAQRAIYQVKRKIKENAKR